MLFRYVAVEVERDISQNFPVIEPSTGTRIIGRSRDKSIKIVKASDIARFYKFEKTYHCRVPDKLYIVWICPASIIANHKFFPQHLALGGDLGNNQIEVAEWIRGIDCGDNALTVPLSTLADITHNIQVAKAIDNGTCNFVEVLSGRVVAFRPLEALGGGRRHRGEQQENRYYFFHSVWYWLLFVYYYL